MKQGYLQNIPEDVSWGISKTLLVRREMIHLKHIKKEIFIRRSVNIHKILTTLDISLFEYMQYICNRENIIFNFNRDYSVNPNLVINYHNTFGQLQKLYDTLDKVIIYSDKFYPIFNYLKADITITNDVREIIESTQKYNISIIISEDKNLLETSWVFGVKTFIVKNDKIAHYSLKTDL